MKASQCYSYLSLSGPLYLYVLYIYALSLFMPFFLILFYIYYFLNSFFSSLFLEPHIQPAHILELKLFLVVCCILNCSWFSVLKEYALYFLSLAFPHSRMFDFLLIWPSIVFPTSKGKEKERGSTPTLIKRNMTQTNKRSFNC